MNLKLLSKIVAAVALVSFMMLGFVGWAVYQQARAAEEAKVHIFELFDLVSVKQQAVLDFLHYRGERAHRDFLLSIEVIREILADPSFEGPNLVPHVRELLSMLDESQHLFGRISSSDEMENSKLFSAPDPVISSHLLLRTQEIEEEIFEIADIVTTSFTRKLSQILTGLFFFAAMLVAMLIFLFVIAAPRRLTLPLLRILEGTRRFAGGDLAYRLNINLPNEVGDLAHAFNEMAARLEEAYAKIAKEAAALEQKNEEMAKFNKIMVNRELAMVELKQRLEACDHGLPHDVIH